MRKATAVLAVFLAAVIVVAGCSRGRSDDAISTDIKAKMFSDPQLKDANLQVTVSNGEVNLSGQVPSDAARLEAYKLASETPGVKKVNDQMAVEVAQVAPPPAPEPAPAPVKRATVHRARRSEPAEYEAPAPPPPPPAPAPVAAAPAAPQPRTVTIPAGSIITIRMIDSVDSSVNHTGEVFHASLDAPIVVSDEVVVPKEQDVYVRLAQAASAGHMSGQSELRLELVSLNFQGKSYPMVSSTYDVKGTSRGKRTAATIGGAAAIGAAIGAIAGGGKGAAIGAGVGAGSGTVYQGVTRGKQVKIPSETRLDFRLEQPLEITYLPRKNQSNQ